MQIIERKSISIDVNNWDYKQDVSGFFTKINMNCLKKGGGRESSIDVVDENMYFT